MKKLVPLLAFIFMYQASSGQGTKADYARAVGLLWENVNNKKAFNLHTTVNWFADSSGFWYNQYARDDKKFYKVTFNPLAKSALFDHALLAGKLNAILKSSFTANNLELSDLKYTRGLVKFTVRKKKFILNTKTNALDEDLTIESAVNNLESKSPDGKWVAYAENHNLFIRSTANGSVKQLSTEGKKNYEYASYYGWSDIIEGENGERPKNFFVAWSPDSKWIQTSICDLRKARKMYLLDWSVDTLYRARLLSYYRGSPGDSTVVHLIPVAFQVETGKEEKLPLPPIAHENGYSFQWSETSGIGFADYRDRGFQKAHLLKIDLNTGKHAELFTESSKTNVDGFDNWIGEKAGKVVVSSERSGWKQLYTIDLKTNETKALTTGNYFVADVYHIDPKGDGTVYFAALGKEPGRNPYQSYLYSISLTGKNLKLLTPEEGTHALAFSPDMKFFVDNYSTPARPTISVLRETSTGKIVMNLSTADISELTAANWKAPEPFTTLGKDGKTTIYGLLWKPTHFDAAKKYPIIDNSYTGPHTSIVPASFVRAVSSNNQSLAELGFVVFMVDGLGTANRSKAFHDFSYKRMGYNLEDHVNAIRQLGRKNNWIDTTRVGIFGHSAGGYDAGHAMLQFPDFYKVGVASSADHDFRMEKAWWPEMYMGWPVDSAYQKQSNVTMAANLKGKLLITHGGIDENVNPSATFKLAEMLERADKQFDMLILPSQRHGYQGDHQHYFVKTRWNYFVRHLLNVAPVWDFAWK